MKTVCTLSLAQAGCEFFCGSAIHQVLDNFTGSLERPESKATEKLLAVHISNLYVYEI